MHTSYILWKLAVNTIHYVINIKNETYNISFQWSEIFNLPILSSSNVVVDVLLTETACVEIDVEWMIVLVDDWVVSISEMREILLTAIRRKKWLK